jgi:hypothetical protein
MPLVSGRERILENPFYVLGLRPECSRMDVEREGQKLLAMLELKLGAAATYATPLGKVERTPEKVRQAMAELRDPMRRLEHELWASMEPVPPADAIDEGQGTPAPWMEGRDLAGRSGP